MMIYNYEAEMIDCLQNVKSFDIFKQGKKISISKKDKNYETIFLFVKSLFENARLMPAFGVSLHHETLYALNNDEWLQINFESEMNKNGLPFSSLLFKLEQTSGINLIRKYNDNYEGRCLYLDLNTPIISYNEITNIL